MTQDERRIYLIRELLKEMPEYSGFQIPGDTDGQRDLLRGLFNVRLAGPAADGFTEVQDEYLRERAAEKGVEDAEKLSPCGDDSRLVLWQGDITTLKCDAVVNAANSVMTGCWRWCHSCIDNAIHTYSGIQTRRDCAEYMENQRKILGPGFMQPTAAPVITPAYNLPSKYIIHVVGPIVNGPLSREDRELLAECYRACLRLADENGCSSIAFCCISTGVFMFPADKAAEIAVSTVKEHLNGHPGGAVDKVIFNVFKDSDREIYEQLLGR